MLPNQELRSVFSHIFDICDDLLGGGGITVPEAHLNTQQGVWGGCAPLRSWKILYFWNWNHAISWILFGENLKQVMSEKQTNKQTNKHSCMDLTDPNFAFWEKFWFKFYYNHKKSVFFFLKISQNIFTCAQHWEGDDYFTCAQHWEGDD